VTTRDPADTAVIVVTIARSGTHLFDSVLERLPPYRRAPKVGLNAKLRKHPVNWIPGGTRVIAGIGRPYPVRIQAVQHALRRIPRGCYGAAQMAYDPAVMELVRKRGMAAIVGVRDPRDVLVSQYMLAKDNADQPLHHAVTAAGTQSAGLTLLLDDNLVDDEHRRAGMGRQIDSLLGWVEQPDVLTVRFEDLIGPRGGGDAAAQVDAILRVAGHLGVALDEEGAARVGEDMFGKGKTFRRGVSGGWRDHIDRETHDLLVDRIGERLERLGYSTAWTA
jgi:hypothetical protein